MAVIALDLGGTKLAGAILTRRGKMLYQTAVPLARRRGRAVGELIVTEINNLLAFARSKRLKVSSVGVAVPGIVNPRSGRVWAPNIQGWRSYPLQRQIEATTSSPAIRVVIDSDRACSILGEAWQGAARGCRHAIFLSVGTGIGAGILVDGKVLRGANDIAGAIGWLALDRPFRREYVACGCFEHHASGVGLAKVACELLAQSQTKTPALQHSNPPALVQSISLTANEIFAAYERHDPVARNVLAQAIEFWGMAVANLVSLFNPEKIIFGGGVFGPARRFLNDIYAEARKWAQPISINRVKLEGSKLRGDAALYGAARLALQAQSA